MHRSPPSRRKSDDEAAACLGVGCVSVWLIYAALYLAGGVALVVILWRAALR